MTSQTKLSLRFVTWNTCGIKETQRSPGKISKLLKTLQDLRADIVFLQETHLGPKCYNILKENPGNNWKVYFTVHKPRSKGVAILIRDKVPFEYICHDEDCSGGYIVLFCRLFGELYTLVNLYKHKADKVVLARLKEYLMETAEGVLICGGDFNTVLHPSFDRNQSSAWHSPGRAILEDFTASLNLRDTWSYLHPTEKDFTRSQNDSYSRLDMFFLQEEKIRQVCSSRVAQQDISDHHPLVLKLRVQKQTEKKIPNVATMLPRTFQYPPKMLDRRPGKISGAEVLSAIKSLTDSENCRPGIDQEENYKTNCCPLTESLKMQFNENRYNFIPKTSREKWIFHKILAKRLSAFITPSFKGKTATKLDKLHTVTFKKGSQKIKWNYIKNRLLDLKRKQLPSEPPAEFSILFSLLPWAENAKVRKDLLPSSPLTNTILNLALKHLETNVYRYEWKCKQAGHLSGKHHKPACKEILSKASVCFQRQVMLIHMRSKVKDDVLSDVQKFQESSGLEINIT
ncbi:uncharacterized protein LOC124384223 [Silurus meridionalis]|uniref:uncharacterized protein LOC124384223 n=1 Tax=Silurus meridionalis TaxID=175797 RepID=UPI001EEA6A3D|nr:uncharacterized protein LOC124384223 [Silurus meridionalis]